MLVLLLLTQQVLASGDFPDPVSRQTGYELRHVPSCPDVGYTLLHETGLNSIGPQSCLLCFCQENSTAVCWRRQNRRCDKDSYQHRITKRTKRAPVGFSDIFFRDAAREVFDRQNPEQCKPFEGSYSEGCPPEDWCIGCTVCDCDANGRWDCHILSFCDDKKGKTQVKKRKGPYRRTKVRKGKQTATKKSTFVTPLPIKKVVNKNTAKRPVAKPQSANKRSAGKKPSNKPVKKPQPAKKPKPTKKPQTAKKPQTTKKAGKTIKKAPVNKKADAPKNNKIKQSTNNKAPQAKILNPKNNYPKKPKIKKPNTKKPNNSGQLSQEAMQHMMTAVKKIITKHNNMTTQAYHKVTKAQQEAVKKMAAEVQKLAMAQKPKKHKKKSNKKKMIYNYKNKKAVVAPQYPPPRRQKRDVVFRTRYQASNGTGPRVYLETNENLYPIRKQRTTLNLIQTAATSTNKADISRHEPIKNDFYKYTVDFTIDNKNTNDTQQKIPERDVFMGLVDSMLNGIKVPKVSLGTFKELGNHSRSKEIYSLTSREMLPNENHMANTQKVDMKQKILKLHHHNMKTLNDASDGKKENIAKDTSNHKTVEATHKTFEAQDVLKSLLREMTTNATRSAKKGKKSYLIKYFRTLFTNYFGKDEKKEKVVHRYRNNDCLNRRHVIEIICENIGSCRITAKNRLQIKSKVNQLNAETKKILKIVKVIKGLLHLLDVPNRKYESKPGGANNSVFDNDVQKLNAVLREGYIEGGTELTQTQLTQIKYVKQNTSEFIKAFGRFATTLDEIIGLLQTNKYNLRGRRKKDPLRNIKALILKYNLVQNSFIQKIYQLLSKIDSRSSITGIHRKVSADRELNNTIEIENYSRSIIKNLRKLKDLAQALSSKRQKRQLMKDNDDAMEYLLMLMEYLLKQNHHLDAAPANDGIDLLIDVIKNAPDIKPIKKNVLDDVSSSVSTTSATIATINTENLDKSMYESNMIQNAERALKKSAEVVHPNHSKVDSYNGNEQTTKSSTAYVYYNKIEDESETITETSTLYPEVTAITYVPEQVYTESPMTLESSERPEKIKHANKIYKDENIEKIENVRERDKGDKGDIGEVRRFEVYTSDTEDDEVIQTESSTTEPAEVVVSDATSAETTTESRVEGKTRRHSSSDNDVSGETTKPKLEWVEDDIGRELKVDNLDIYQINTTEPTDAMTTTTAATVSTLAQKRVEVSSVTEEISVKRPIRTKSIKMSPEEVMYRKQMDLLNSLDYVTERSDFEDTDSKDVSEVTDTFSSYFG